MPSPLTPGELPAGRSRSGADRNGSTRYGDDAIIGPRDLGRRCQGSVTRWKGHRKTNWFIESVWYVLIEGHARWDEWKSSITRSVYIISIFTYCYIYIYYFFFFFDICTLAYVLSLGWTFAVAVTKVQCGILEPKMYVMSSWGSLASWEIDPGFH